MNKLSCTTLAAVVGGLATCTAFAERLVEPVTPQVIPASEMAAIEKIDARLAGQMNASNNADRLRSGAQLGEVLKSREFAAARSAIGDTYSHTIIRLADNPFGGAAGNYLQSDAPPVEPQDPVIDPDGIPDSGDEFQQPPLPQYLFLFEDGNDFTTAEAGGRDFVGLDVFVIEFETLLSDGNVLVETAFFSDDPGHGGDFVIPGIGFNFTDPDDPNNVQFAPIDSLRADVGNNAFGDSTAFPEEGDPGWEDNMLQHGQGPGTVVDRGLVFFKGGTGFYGNGLVPSDTFLSPITEPDIVGTGTRDGQPTFPADQDVELTAFGGIGFVFAGPDGEFGTPDDIPATLGGYGVSQMTTFWEYDPDAAPTTPGACCIGGSISSVDLNTCLTGGGTFYGVGSDVADVNCPDCVVAFDSASADEASTLGFLDDQPGAGDFSYNDGCDGGGSFTPVDSAGNSLQGPAASGTAETVIGPKWQGTLATASVSGEFINDADWYTFTPAADGTITIDVAAEAPVIISVLAGDCGSEVVLNSVRVGDSTTDGNCTDQLKTNVFGGGVAHYIVVEVAADVLFLGSGATTGVTGAGNFGYEFQATVGALENAACVTADACVETTSVDCFDNLGGIAFQPGIDCATVLADPDTFGQCPDIWAGVTAFENESAATQVFTDQLEPTIIVDNFNGGICDGGTFLSLPLAEGVTTGGETSIWLFDAPTVTGDDVQLVNLWQRDIDTWEYNHSGGTLTVDVTAQFALQLDVVEIDCNNLPGTIVAGTIFRDIVAPNSLPACAPGSLEVDLPSGIYYLRVTNDLDESASALEGFGQPSRYTITASSGSACVVCPDTSRSDGQVNTDDLLAVLGAFGQSGNPGDFPGDTTCDGNVNTDDLLAVLGVFGQSVTCP